MVQPNVPINYQTLIDDFRDWMQQNCNNIDEYSDQVPAAAKPGFSSIVSGSKASGGSNAGGGARARIRESTVLPVVELNDVVNELYDFLHARGINTKSDKSITTKGVINFWNNIAAFCANRIVLMNGQHMSSTIRMFKSAGRDANLDFVFDYDEVPPVDDTVKMTAQDVETMLHSLESVLNKESKIHMIRYDYEMFCCSTSSSCSSSSSSMFVAYMNLGGC